MAFASCPWYYDEVGNGYLTKEQEEEIPCVQSTHGKIGARQRDTGRILPHLCELTSRVWRDMEEFALPATASTRIGQTDFLRGSWTRISLRLEIREGELEMRDPISYGRVVCWNLLRP